MQPVFAGLSMCGVNPAYAGCASPRAVAAYAKVGLTPRSSRALPLKHFSRHQEDGNSTLESEFV
jgi:hypothetical protein